MTASETPGSASTGSGEQIKEPTDGLRALSPSKRRWSCNHRTSQRCGAATRCNAQAFSLVEMLMAVFILTLLIALFTGLMHQTSTMWRRTTGKIEQFQEARDAFETMTRRLGQATLNVYWDYDNANAPTKYERNSELRFISGPADDLLGPSPDGRERPTHAVFFQAPFGVSDDAAESGFPNLLNTWGYYVEYGDDLRERPPFITAKILAPRYRYRLMELRQVAERDSIYDFTSGFDSAGLARSRTYTGKQWFQSAVNVSAAPVRVVAQNVVALIITPRLSQSDELAVKGSSDGMDASPLAPNYLYDSSPPAPGVTDSRYKDGRLNPVNQLPPLLQVTMVTMDEASAGRMNFQSGTKDFFALKERFLQSADHTRDLLQTGDTGSLENALISRKANYRIFSTNIQLQGAKWSRAQTN